MNELLEQLEMMEWKELRELWAERYGADGSHINGKEFLRRQIAARIQEERYGGLTSEIKRRLRDLARSYANDLKHTPETPRTLLPGSTLTRNWKGTVHTVEVCAEGFMYKGNHYKGLSKIAREITGTRWSGPLFFGLRKPAKKVKVAS
jgi:hypothetical protein